MLKSSAWASLLPALGAIALGGCSISSVPDSAAELPVSQPPAPTVGQAIAPESAEISVADRAAIRQLGVPLVVPTDLPPETYLSDVVVESAPDFGQGYTLYYRYFLPEMATATCFQVEYADGGFGGPVPPNSQPITAPAIAQPGQTYSLYWAGDDSPNEDSPFLANAVFSDWIEVPGVPGGYRLSSGLIESERVRACNWIDPDSAARIVSSLSQVEP